MLSTITNQVQVYMLVCILTTIKTLIVSVLRWS